MHPQGNIIIHLLHRRHLLPMALSPERARQVIRVRVRSLTSLELSLEEWSVECLGFFSSTPCSSNGLLHQRSVDVQAKKADIEPPMFTTVGSAQTEDLHRD